tara:strand:+ start:396 stop:1160 length:765 start_codon:yes stop_codon:yes gene_type:complete
MKNDHYFIHNRYTPEQVEQIRSKDSPSEYKAEFLTTKEFETLRKLCMTIRDWPEHGSVSKYKGQNYDEGIGPMVKNILHEKLLQWIGPHQLDFFAWQEAITPWKIHPDIRWHQDRLPYKMILIPLDVEPTSGPVDTNQWPETYTIAFKQRDYLEGHTNTGTGSDGNDQSEWTRVADGKHVHNLVEGYQISKEEHQKYFSHVPYDHLERLSIDAVHRWIPGCAFYWDNDQMHCADDFISNNIRTKRSLLVCTNQA